MASKHFLDKPITYSNSKRKRPLHLQPNNDMAFTPNTNQIDFNPPPTAPPRPPRSQKDAMAMAQPSQSDISTLVELIGITRDEAARWLRIKNNDTAQVFTAVFDNQENLQEQEAKEYKSREASVWNEDLMSADRDGDQRENNHLRPLASTAPGTRRPSPSGSGIHPATQADEDAQLARAIQASQQTSGYHGASFQQESGIVGKDGTERVHFGPATQDSYDNGQWGMVRTAQATSEVVEDAGVEQRQSVKGQPRFIKHLPDGDYLPNLLTICHGVAGVREAMLARKKLQANYGQDPEWWKGHDISRPRIVDTVSGQPVDQEDDDALIAEVQRLMAFMDQSERSYASAVPLTQVDALKKKIRPNQPAPLMTAFLDAWSDVDTKLDRKDMFRTTFGMDESSLIFNIPTPAVIGQKSDLREILDATVWGPDAEEGMRLGFDRLADVVVMNLRCPNPAVGELGVKVYPELFMERYLQENNEAAADLREAVGNGLTKLRKMGAIEEKLTTWKHPKLDLNLSPFSLLKHSRFVFQQKTELPNNETGAPATLDTPSKDLDLRDQLDKVIANIDSKLKLLAIEKDKTAASLAEISRARLPESGSQSGHRYRLRGVATKPNVTYVLLTKDEDEDEEMPLLEPNNGPTNNTLEKDEDTDTPEGTQWWRIQYETNGSSVKISKNKMPGYEVLRAVELEYGSALLVYANDTVNDISLQDPSLPLPLQEFVDTDNALFQVELEEAAQSSRPPAYEGYGGDVNVRESIERNSMDSTHVERADSITGGPRSPEPPGYGEDEFMEHAGFGLGPNGVDVKQKEFDGEEEDDGPVDEIHLEEVEVEDRMEMSEREHQPLIPGLGHGGSDVTMQGMESQDAGAAGSEHLDDMDCLK
ncbi:hypothetical protein LTR15_012238 [Elasticomyces elasticus]|nr:hypothetical protein LTR15_012238 [Elasticomyces elasticus]